MLNEATFLEILLSHQGSISRKVASLNIFIYDVLTYHEKYDYYYMLPKFYLGIDFWNMQITNSHNVILY